MTKTLKCRRQIVADAIAISNSESVKTISESLGVSWNFAKKCSMLSDESEEAASSFAENGTSLSEVDKMMEEFYARPDIAIMIPDRRRVKKDLVPRSVLCTTLKKAHAEFVASTGKQVSYSKFKKCRPQHVLTADHRSRTSCLCIHCANVGQKLKVLQKLMRKLEASGNNTDQLVEHMEEAVAVTLCARDPSMPCHRPACVNRKCGECGVKRLINMYQPLDPSNEVSRLRWELVKKDNSNNTGNVTKQVKASVLFVVFS